MTYQEAMQAEAEMQAAISAPAKQRKPRGATRAQLAYRARLFGTPASIALVNDGSFAARSGR